MADQVPRFSPTHQKKVLLFGKSGSGKSTVANALVTGGLTRVVFEPRDGVRACTRRIQIETEGGWTVVDTVGLGGGKAGSTSNKKARDMLTAFLTSVKNEYSHIIYVVKADRITDVDESIWEAFAETFKGGEDGFVVLITAANDEWLKEQRGGLPGYLTVCPILVTDIPPIRQGSPRWERRNEKIRGESIKKLGLDLERLFRERDYKYVVPAIGLYDGELGIKSLSKNRTMVESTKRLVVGRVPKVARAVCMTCIEITGFVIGVLSFSHDP